MHEENMFTKKKKKLLILYGEQYILMYTLEHNMLSRYFFKHACNPSVRLSYACIQILIF